MSTNRSSFYAGLGLITLGIVFLVTYIFPGTWPVVLVALGVFLLIVAALRREGWPVTSGLVNITLGSILLYQTVTQDWKSWYYLWPLIFAAAGAGLLITPTVERLPGNRPRLRYLRISWAWLGLGLLASLVLWIFRAQISWPSILWVLGVLFLLQTIISGIGPLAIPGTIFTGLGLMLAWQNMSGEWSSWAYTWALLPGFVGLGLFLAFLHSRTMRVIGLSMLGWSLVAFILFGTFFARDGALARFWPIALIVAGIAVMAQGLLVRRPTSPAH